MSWLFPGSSGQETKWIRIAVLCIMGAFLYDRYKDSLTSDAEAERAAPGAESKVEKETESWLEARLKQYAETETGREVLGALTRGRLKQETGADDPSLALAQAAGGEARYYDAKAGDGAAFLKCGDEALAEWRLIDKHNAEIMDTRRQGGERSLMRVGDGSLVPGAERSLEGMRPGGVRRIYVPSLLAYEDTGFFNSYIIPKDPVTFEIELKRMEPAPVPVAYRIVGEKRIADNAAPALACGMGAEIDISVAGRAEAPKSFRFAYGRPGDFPIWAQRWLDGLKPQESRSVEMAKNDRAQQFLRDIFGESDDAWYKDGFALLELTLRTVTDRGREFSSPSQEPASP